MARAPRCPRLRERGVRYLMAGMLIEWRTEQLLPGSVVKQRGKRVKARTHPARPAPGCRGLRDRKPSTKQPRAAPRQGDTRPKAPLSHSKATQKCDAAQADRGLGLRKSFWDKELSESLARLYRKLNDFFGGGKKKNPARSSR